MRIDYSGAAHVISYVRAMDDPVTWGNSEITWRRQNGYTLRLQLWADERALSLREKELVAAIKMALPGRSEVRTVVSPMVIEEDSRATSAEPGEIAITTDTMVSLQEAECLRDSITQVLRGVTAEAEKADAAHNDKAAAVLAVLRGAEPPPPPAPSS
jgi:hypothetical protein